MTVDIDEAYLAQPGQLCLDVQQLVRWVFFVDRDIKHFRMQRSLSRMHEMVNSKARHDCVEQAIGLWECEVQVMEDNAGKGRATESCLEAVDHRFGEIDGHGPCLCMDEREEGQQATVTTTEIKKVRDRSRQTFEQGRLTFGPVRNRAGAFSQQMREVRNGPSYHRDRPVGIGTGFRDYVISDSADGKRIGPTNRIRRRRVGTSNLGAMGLGARFTATSDDGRFAFEAELDWKEIPRKERYVDRVM